jgi:hypothetical protein
MRPVPLQNRKLIGVPDPFALRSPITVRVGSSERRDDDGNAQLALFCEKQLSRAQIRLAGLRATFGQEHPEILYQEGVVEAIRKQVQGRVAGPAPGIALLQSLRQQWIRANARWEGERRIRGPEHPDFSAQALILEEITKQIVEKLGGQVMRGPVEGEYNERVIEVRLANAPVGDAELTYLGVLFYLRSLDLAGTQVTDAGLEHLKTLAHLQSLVTERIQLQILDLTNSRVTNESVKKLQQALPDCKILH